MWSGKRNIPVRTLSGEAEREFDRGGTSDARSSFMWSSTLHVHMMISIPPKYAVSKVVGFINGKSAIHMARMYAGSKQNYVGQHFWARGYFA